MSKSEREATRSYRFQNRPLAFIGLMLLFVGLRFFLDPGAADDTAAVARVSAGFTDDLWSLCFVIGGAGLIYGTQRPNPRVERAGVILCGSAVLLNLVVTLVLFHSLATLALVVPHIALFLVCHERAWHLTRLDREAAARMESGP